jgi:hypothetical protein
MRRTGNWSSRINKKCARLGIFNSRSDVICSILHQALQVLPISKMIPKLHEIQQLRKEVKIELTDLGKQVRQGGVDAFGEEYTQKHPYATIEKDAKGFLGFDYDLMEMVTNRGKTRIAYHKMTFQRKRRKLSIIITIFFLKAFNGWKICINQ